MNYRTIKTLKAMTEDILRDIPDTRDSDVALTIAIWRTFYSDLLIDLNKVELVKLFDLPREDFIGRIRRKLQAKGKYLPTKEHIAKARGLNIDEWRVSMNYPTKETTRTPIPSWTPPSERLKQKSLL